MEATLTYILEKYAARTEKQAKQSLDIREKSYLAGKADGLRLAKDLLHMIVKYGSAENSELAEAPKL